MMNEDFIPVEQIEALTPAHIEAAANKEVRACTKWQFPDAYSTREAFRLVRDYNNQPDRTVLTRVSVVSVDIEECTLIVRRGKNIDMTADLLTRKARKK